MLCFSLGLSCVGLCFVDLGGCFLSHVRKFFDCYLFKFFSAAFCFSSGIPIIWMLVRLMLYLRSLRLSSFLFILFSLFYSASVISTILSVHLSTLLTQLFCYWFPLAYFLFQSLWCSSLIVRPLPTLSWEPVPSGIAKEPSNWGQFPW